MCTFAWGGRRSLRDIWSKPLSQKKVKGCGRGTLHLYSRFEYEYFSDSPPFTTIYIHSQRDFNVPNCS